jgi:hypothetical protein
MVGRRAAAGVVAGLIALMGVSSCSSSTPRSLHSNTPAIATGAGSSSQKSALLTTDDLRAIPGAPADIRVASPDQPTSLYQNPDQIGPCGQKLAIPTSSRIAVREFGSASLNGFQMVLDVSAARATAFVTAWQDDTRPGCPPSSSRTNTGSTQTQTLVAAIPLPDLVDQATGALLRITNMGQTLAAYALVFRSGGRLDFNVLFSAKPLSSAFGNGFAQRAETALNTLVGISSSPA